MSLLCEEHVESLFDPSVVRVVGSWAQRARVLERTAFLLFEPLVHGSESRFGLGVDLLDGVLDHVRVALGARSRLGFRLDDPQPVFF